MHDKKQSTPWRIALIHLVISGFIIPWLFSIVFVPILYLLFRRVSGETDVPLWLYLLVLVLSPIVIWLRVRYSTQFIGKKYIVHDSEKILRLSMFYVVSTHILCLVGMHVFFLTVFNTITDGCLTIFYTITLLEMIVFYISSKKYLLQDEAMSAGDQSALATK